MDICALNDLLGYFDTRMARWLRLISQEFKEKILERQWVDSKTRIDGRLYTKVFVRNVVETFQKHTLEKRTYMERYFHVKNKIG
jgi:hypothetical protein